MGTSARHFYRKLPLKFAREFPPFSTVKMSDFDAFASSEPPAQEDDPAADFLAREQDQMAALEGDEFGAFDAGSAEAPQDSGAGADFDPFSAEPPAMGEPNLDEPNFDENAPSFTDAADMGYDTIPDTVPQTFDPLDMDQPPAADSQSADPYASIKNVDTMRQEPEKIIKWREEQKIMLEEKDIQSEKKKAEWREIAKKELEDWYKHRDEQHEKTKKNNREAEAAFCADRDESVPGHEFEKVCRLCEFNPKASRTTKDVSRMRSILLQLKQTPLEREMAR